MSNYFPLDFDIRGTVLVKYKGTATHVTVPNGVTVIGEQAFADKTKLLSITLPDTVTEIQYQAFLNCSALEYVVIPRSVTKLGQLLFWGSVQATIYTPEGSAAYRYAKVRRMATQPNLPSPQKRPPTPVELSIPANWNPKDHPLLAARQEGPVHQLRGRILITVYFVDDTESHWEGAYEAAYRRIHEQTMRELEQAAFQRNIPLQIHTVYKRFKATTKCPREYGARWSSRWAPQCSPDPAPGYDEKPVILALNKVIRGFAFYSPGANLEISVIGTANIVVSSRTLCHELFHNFGAPDLYRPSRVKKLAAIYLPESVMNDGDVTDDLTAYCIGWTDTLSPAALGFLWETRNMNL